MARRRAMVVTLAVLLGGCRDRATVKKDPTPEPRQTPDARSDGMRHVWSKLYSSANDRLPRDLAVDAAGNAIVVGRFVREIDFGSGPIESSGGSDAFAFSVSPTGVTRWARALGGFLFDEALAVVVGVDGTTYVAGDLTGDADLGTGRIGAGIESAPFIAALDANGKTVWARVLSGGGEITGIAVTPTGDLQVVGRDLIARACKGTADVSVARLTPTGDPKWTLCMDTTGFGRAQRVALDPTGDVLVCGTFRSHASFGGMAMVAPGPALLPSSSADQLFVTKLAGKDGSVVWANAGFGEGASCLAMASTSDGGVAIGGYYAGAIAFGETKLPVVGYRDGFVASYTNDGTLRFAAPVGDQNDGDSLGAIAIGPNGELLVAGDLGPGAMLGSVGAKVKGAYVAELDARGDVRWARRFVGGTPMGLARGPGGTLTLAGDLFVTTDTPPKLDLGGGPLVAVPAEGGLSHFDVFVVQLAP